MKGFIKVQSVNKDTQKNMGSGLILIAAIKGVCPTNLVNVRAIHMANEHYFVEETLEQIEELIENDR